MKHQISLWAVACAMVLFVPASAWAKRGAPKPVPPVVAGSVEYSAPHESMGVVVATDTRSRKELWRVRIYTVTIDPALERDVQDVFITSLALEKGQLVIVDENRNRYTLDLATHKVTPQK